MQVFRILSLISVFLFSGVSGIAQAVPDGRLGWVTDARRLTGESDAVRVRAMARLRVTPKIEEVLKDGLKGANRFLALDVISALSLRSMLSYLLEYGEKETSGYVIHTVNTLLQPADRERVFQVYRKRLETKGTSFPNQVALIDSFSRTNERLEAPLIRRLLEEGSPEVRSSVIHYLRSQILKYGRDEYFTEVLRALADPAFQNRLQVYYLISEFTPRLRLRHVRTLEEAAGVCAEDPAEEVRQFCTRVFKAGGAK